MSQRPTDAVVIDVLPQHRFDEGALDAWMRENVRDYKGPLKVRQFQGGMSNPTFVLDTPARSYVMRKKPPGMLLKSAHQVDREYTVMKALQGSDVPVPEVFALCTDDAVLGQDFYIMNNVEGRVLINTALPSFTKAERTALYEHLAVVLAALHKVDPAAVGLSEFGRAGNYYARQLSRWSKQYVASVTEDLADMNFLMEWLPANIPQADETTIVHGDYRIGNCVLHPTEPRIVAVLDWELSTLGHPLADLAYVCQEYYGNLTGTGFADLEDPRTIGIPSEEEFVARYCELTGQPKIENWGFYMAYTLFRSAAIVQGVYKRGLDGNASSESAKRYADAARIRSSWAMDVLRKSGLI
ncbi:MAG: phosphotransferase [Pseudomonadota bacterium]|nr:phosphotransferase [Pseudomonadota bacterium]